MLNPLKWRALVCLVCGLLIGCQSLFIPQEMGDILHSSGMYHDGKLDDKQTAQLLLATANNFNREGHYQKAAALYEKARRHDPTLELSRQIASNYARLGMFKQAEVEFRQALQLAPEDADLLNDFGCLCLRSKKIPEAISLLERAIEADPQHSHANMNLAECMVRSGQVQRGIELFSRQVGSAAALSNTGILLASMGRTDESRDLLQKALSEDPTLLAAKTFSGSLDQIDVAAKPMIVAK